MIYFLIIRGFVVEKIFFFGYLFLMGIMYFCIWKFCVLGVYKIELVVDDDICGCKEVNKKG